MLAQYRQATEQHRQRVYSFAYYSLRAKEDAEDVTQEVFIKLWQHWQKVDHGKLGAWLMRVAHNAVIDHVRKQRPAQANLDHYADVDDQAGRSDQGTEIDQQIFKDQLQLAIKSLDDPFRSIIVMRDVQGLSYADIQVSLGMSESQVKVYLHRGRRKLRANTRLRQLFDENLAQKSRVNQSDAGSDQRSAYAKGNQHA
ncbi:MAG: sigma-70 family RNA polymerase sigma factor [Proteobacteria bacterium]|nr:sigma-70 family RNA polymerase sigma factor [Pseudomonadota bacterium]